MTSIVPVYTQLRKVEDGGAIALLAVDENGVEIRVPIDQDTDGEDWFLRNIDGVLDFSPASGSDTSKLSWKTVVRAASTANVTLASAVENGDVLDGVTLATGDRILLKNQTTGSQNGIYTVNASGAPTRATDMDEAIEFIDAAVLVSEGTINADTAWVCTTNAPITVGTTTITFAAFAAAYTADEVTITLSGGQFSVKSGGIGPTQLASTAVTAGTYGDATHSPRITVDADGRLTSVVEDLIGAGAGVPSSNSQLPGKGAGFSEDDFFDSSTGSSTPSGLDSHWTTTLNYDGADDDVTIETTEQGWLRWVLRNSATFAHRMVLQSLVAGACKFRVEVAEHCSSNHTIAQNDLFGIVFRESSSNKFIVVGMTTRTSVFYNATFCVTGTNHSGSGLTTKNSNLGMAVGPGEFGTYEIERDGSGNIICRQGKDGCRLPQFVFTDTETSLLGASHTYDQVGFFASHDSDAGRTVVALFRRFWRVA